MTTQEEFKATWRWMRLMRRGDKSESRPPFGLMGKCLRCLVNRGTPDKTETARREREWKYTKIKCRRLEAEVEAVLQRNGLW